MTIAPLRTALPVSAVLVVRDGARWLPDTLDAVAAQTQPPQRLVIVDLASTDGSLEIAQEHTAVRRVVAEVTVRSLSTAVGYAAAVAQGVADLSEPQAGDPEWLWLLHDDGAPEPQVLELLADAVRRSPSVAVAGPKIVRWEDARIFVENGIQLTRAGRRISLPRPGERDQGQYDARSDVIAVATNGMLVRRDVFAELGGFDAGFGPLGVDVDFGWRAQLAGHRVVVVPAARVREASASATGDRRGSPSARRSDRQRRQASRQVALARSSAFAAPLLGVWVGVSSILSFLGLLLLKRPRHAWAELGDASVLLRPGPILRSRHRFRGLRRVAPRDLHGLFIGPRAAARHTWDLVQGALTPSWTLERRAPAALGAIESGPVAEEAEDLAAAPAGLVRRSLTNPGLLVTLVAAATSAVFWRAASTAFRPDSLGLAGGQLRAVESDSAGLWHSFRDWWHGAGLGAAGEPAPLTALLSAVTWLTERVPGVADGVSPASVALAWMLLLAMPAAATSAYLAGRVVTTARWPRALAALVWACSGVLVVALQEGRLPVVLAHILLPAVLSGYVRVSARDASGTATFATALATAVVGVCVPVFLVLATVAALVMLAVAPGRGRRVRALALAVVPTALTGAWVLRFVKDPVQLLAAPGLGAPAGGPYADLLPWQAALGLLSAPASWSAYLLGPALVLAVVGLAWPSRRGGSGVAAATVGVLAALGLAAALAAPRVVIGALVTGEGSLAPAVLWPGVGQQLYLLGVSALVCLGASAMTQPRRWPRWRRGVLALVPVAVAATTVGGAAWLSWTASTRPMPVTAAALPAVAADQASGPRAARLLALDVTSPGRVDYRLIGAEPGEVVAPATASPIAPDPVLASLARRLAEVGGPVDTLALDLATDGIAFVTVTGDSEGDLGGRLDTMPGLTRLGSSDGRVLWRVVAVPSATDPTLAVAPSRVRLTDASGRPLAEVPVSGPHGAVNVALPAGSGPRTLRVAEAPGWASRSEVSYGGVLLTDMGTGGRPRYAIPETSGQLVIDLPPAHRFWHYGQLGVLALVLFLAIPFGNRRSREREWTR